MIISSEKRPVNSVENLRAGKGTVTFTHFCAPENLPKKCRLATQITLKKGCSIGRHPHSGETEFFYILSGEGITPDDDGKDTVVRAGDIVITGGGDEHFIEATSDEPLEIIAFIVLD